MAERRVVVGETAIARVLTVSLTPSEEEKMERYDLGIITRLDVARPSYFWKMHANARACFTYSYAREDVTSDVQLGEKTLGCSSAYDAWGESAIALHKFPASITNSKSGISSVLVVKAYLFGLAWESLLAEGAEGRALVV